MIARAAIKQNTIQDHNDILLKNIVVQESPLLAPIFKQVSFLDLVWNCPDGIDVPLYYGGTPAHHN